MANGVSYELPDDIEALITAERGNVSALGRRLGVNESGLSKKLHREGLWDVVKAARGDRVVSAVEPEAEDDAVSREEILEHEVRELRRLAGRDRKADVHAERITQAIERAEWEAKARSGRPEDIFMLGSYYAKSEQRIDLACPYFLLAARKGYKPAVNWLNRCDVSNPKESFALTKACAEKGDMTCMYNYGWYFASIRNPSSPSPVAADDEEALRWFDRAAELGMKAAKVDAARLRQKMSGAEAPPEPAPAPAAQPSPPARPAPVYVAKPRRTGQEAACARLVERLERDRQRAATRPQDVGVQRALANLEQRYSAGCR